MVNRRIVNDTRGWISELLAKAINKGSLDAELSGRRQGAVPQSPHHRSATSRRTTTTTIVGSSRSGYAVEPGIETLRRAPASRSRSPICVKSDFWNHRFYQAEEYEWQPTLFQPVGGMDRSGARLPAEASDAVHPVQPRSGRRPQRHEDGQGEECRHRAVRAAVGSGETITADWCISTIPLPILATIKDNNFSQTYKRRDRGGEVRGDVQGRLADRTPLLGDENQIYGGISYTTDTSRRCGTRRTTTSERRASSPARTTTTTTPTRWRRWSREKRLVDAMNGGEEAPSRFRQARPDRARPVDRLEARAVSARRLGRRLGVRHDDLRSVCSNAEGRFWVAGDQVSYLSGWQEGAVRSAHHVIEGITKPKAKLMATPAPKVETPGLGSRRASDAARAGFRRREIASFRVGERCVRRTVARYPFARPLTRP